MTPQERDLIQNVFDRLAAHAGAKDAEADLLIANNLRRQPDAAYGLVQAVVMLEAGLQQAQARISDLQRQQSAAPAAGGSFLGNGGPWATSLPPSSQSVAPQAAAPQPVYYQPTPLAAAQPASPWAQPVGGSSFLRNAATMAAGVAGGTLIAEGLTSLLGGHGYGGGIGGGYGGGFGGGFEGGPREVVENVTVNNYYDNQSSGQGADVSGVQDASYDSSDDFSGGSDDGFDI